IQMDRTGAAGTVLATNMRSGQPEILAQEIRQMQSRLNLTLECATIDSNADTMSPRHSPSAQEPGEVGGITGAFGSRGLGRPPSAKTRKTTISSGRGAPAIMTVIVSISSKDHGSSLCPNGISIAAPAAATFTFEG